ncbi:TPA: ankyrin repeat domain-containing protein [Escherichia coli]|uniref:ankyrin repeat domain-containing protein n=1 Tax=Escherichia coli TaxID=562 RepID=UPI0028783A41|nr:ankyrin repeat domain-containing protein [Escherichia coli]MDS1600923.1 ankyrin repeat domain-containing protein [Escherichia coli]HAW1061230.1 ankyrin repeat domain-containing protein [Escherichia coli]
MMSVNGDVHTIILSSSTTNTTKDLYYDGNKMPLAGVKAILDTSTGGFSSWVKKLLYAIAHLLGSEKIPNNENMREGMEYLKLIFQSAIQEEKYRYVIRDESGEVYVEINFAPEAKQLSISCAGGNESICCTEKEFTNVKQNLIEKYCPRNYQTSYDLVANKLYRYDILEELMACDNRGESILFRAMRDGDTDLIESLHLSELTGKGGLTSSKMLKLLETSSEGGTPGLYMAMKNGRYDMLDTILGLLAKLPVNYDINKNDVLRLLKAKNSDPRSNSIEGLEIAMTEGHDKILITMLEMLPDVVKRFGITNDEMRDLINPRRGDDRALSKAMLNGKENIVTAMQRLLPDHAEKLQLSKEDVFNILSSFNDKTSQNPSGLFKVMSHGKVNMLKFMLDNLCALPEEVFTKEDILGFLAVKNANGMTGMAHAMSYGHVEIVKAMLDRLCSMKGEFNITKDYVLNNILASKNGNGWTGISLAIAHGHVEILKTILDALPMLNDKFDITGADIQKFLFAKIDEDISGWTKGMDRGNKDKLISMYKMLFDNILMDNKADIPVDLLRELNIVSHIVLTETGKPKTDEIARQSETSLTYGQLRQWSDLSVRRAAGSLEEYCQNLNINVDTVKPYLTPDGLTPLGVEMRDDVKVPGLTVVG